MICALFAEGLLHQLILPVNHDVSWLLVATGRLLDGADIYGRDVVEFNPPMILYLFAPPVAFGRAFSISTVLCLRVYVLLLAAISLLLCREITKRIVLPERAQVRRYLMVLLALVFVVDRTRNFAQREHLMLILLAPYLLLVAARVMSLEIPRRLALCVGIAAGLGIALKPHHLVLPLVLECYIAVRHRTLRAWLRPEIAALVGTGLALLVVLLVYTPGYPFFVLPLSLDTYWAYQVPRAELMRRDHLEVFLLSGLLVLLTRRSKPLRELGWVLMLAAGCFYVAYVAQATGWRYHRIPFHAVLIVAACLPLLAQLGSLDDRNLPTPYWGAVTGGVAAASLTFYVLLFGPTGHGAALGSAISLWQRGETLGAGGGHVGLVEQHAAGGTIYAFSGSVRLGFPVVTQAGVTWSSRFSHLWPLVAVTRWRDELSASGKPPDPDELARIEEIERYVTEAVIEDLELRPPDLVFVEHPYRSRHILGRDFDYLAHFLREPRFREIWEHYEPVKSGLIATTYLRRD
jgi:hypothetical protein